MFALSWQAARAVPVEVEQNTESSVISFTYSVLHDHYPRNMNLIISTDDETDEAMLDSYGSTKQNIIYDTGTIFHLTFLLISYRNVLCTNTRKSRVTRRVC
jgi:hypothetical protein